MVNNEAVVIPCLVRSVGFEQWLVAGFLGMCIMYIGFMTNTRECGPMWFVLSLLQFVG